MDMDSKFAHDLEEIFAQLLPPDQESLPQNTPTASGNMENLSGQSCHFQTSLSDITSNFGMPSKTLKGKKGNLPLRGKKLTMGSKVQHIPPPIQTEITPKVDESQEIQTCINSYLIPDPLAYMLEIFDKVISSSIVSEGASQTLIRRQLYRRAFCECATEHLKTVQQPIPNVEIISQIIFEVSLKIGILIQ